MSRRRTTPGSVLTGAVRKCTSGCATPRPVHRRSAAECDADVGPSAGTATLLRPQALLAAIDWLGLAASVPHAALAFVPAMAAPFIVGRVAFWIGYLACPIARAIGMVMVASVPSQDVAGSS